MKVPYLLFSALAVFISNQAFAIPIFDGIELTKTKMEDYIKKRSSCPNARLYDEGVFMYDASCLGIPAETVKIFPNNQGTVEGVILSIASGQANEALNAFSKAFTKKWGKPVKKSIPFVGDRQIIWRKHGIHIELNQEHLNFYSGYIWFATQERVDLIEKRQQQEVKDKQSKVEEVL